METLTIKLKSEKAHKLIKDLEDLNIIEVLKTPASLSSLRHQIKTKMSSEEIDKQLQTLRDEWQSNI